MTVPCHYLLLTTLWGQRVSASLKMLLPAIQLVLAAVTKVKQIEEILLQKWDVLCKSHVPLRSC